MHKSRDKSLPKNQQLFVNEIALKCFLCCKTLELSGDAKGIFHLWRNKLAVEF